MAEDKILNFQTFDIFSVCDQTQCPPISDKCPIKIPNGKECCPSNACPPDPIEGRVPCDDGK